MTPSEPEIQQLRDALTKIADHTIQLPGAECARIARAALGSCIAPKPSVRKPREVATFPKNYERAIR